MQDSCDERGQELSAWDSKINGIIACLRWSTFFIERLYIQLSIYDIKGINKKNPSLQDIVINNYNYCGFKMLFLNASERH